MLISPPVKVRVATVVIVSLFTTPLAPLVVAQAPTTAKPAPATAKPAAATAKPAAPAPADGGWPRSYATAGGAALVVYQPQISSWVDQKRIVAYAAVAYSKKGMEKSALGTIKLESNTSVAVDQRLVSFSEFAITESNFPTLPREQLQTVLDHMTDGVTMWDKDYTVLFFIPHYARDYTTYGSYPSSVEIKR